jgi:hypothetical protein
MVAAILLSLLIGAGQPVTAEGNRQAQVAAPSTQISPAKQAAALTLAKLYMPVDTLVDVELIAFDAQFATQIAKNPDVAALEKKAPGAINAMAMAARPLIKEIQGRKVAQTQAEVGGLFARRLSEQDIAELTAFYQTPEARSALRKIALGVDVSQTVEKVALNPDYQVQSSDLQRNLDTGVANGSGQLTASEKAALDGLEEKPAYQKLEALDPDIEALVLSARNHRDPDSDRLIQAAMAKAVEQHMTKVRAAQPNGVR